MTVHTQAQCVARLLQQTDRKVVFAESCTGGRASASLTKFAGISAHHCGGVVVYRNETKTAYLGIPSQLLKKHGAVSKQVAELMAERVLEKTPEADIAVAVTGHLGPNAPKRLDGVAYIAVVQRVGPGKRNKTVVKVQRLSCTSTSRNSRQTEVVEAVMRSLAESLVD